MSAKMSCYAGPVSTLPALTLAAAGLGLGHAVLPDHWIPLAVLARARGYAVGRVLRLSLGAGVAHVAVSLGLGAVVALVGVGLRDSVARHADLVVGGVLLLTGAVLLATAGRGHGHAHDDHEAAHGHGRRHDHDHAGHPHEHDGGHHHGHSGHGHSAHEHGHSAHGHDGDRNHDHAPIPAATMLLERSTPPAPTRAGLLVAFGAAASPDLTILPVFLAAGSLGPAAAAGTLTAFAVATIVAITGLTTVAALGARRLTAPWSERAANRAAAVTLLVIGALVVTGVL
jgi:nickel/cobalt transporter (NicO) family protein